MSTSTTQKPTTRRIVGMVVGIVIIGLGISESGGGIPGITAAAVVITGVEGAMLAPLFARCFRITDPVAEGVAIGASSHAVGTSKALEIGPLQGAMSSIAICVCGIFTSVLALFF